MAQKPLSDELLNETARAVSACNNSVSEAARALDLPRPTVEHRYKEYLRRHGGGRPPNDSAAAPPNPLDVPRVKALEAEVKRLKAELLQESARGSIVDGIAQRGFAPPKWLQPAKGKNVERAIATAMLSDLHLDEVVKPAEMNYVNAYNREIAEMRLRRFFASVIRLMRDYIAGIKVDGLVLALDGDLVSGNIHEELEATNADSVIGTCLHWSEQLAAGIEMLLETGVEIYAPCIGGNHGRIRQDVRYKGRPRDSFDYLICKLLERHFKGVKEIKFDVSESTEARWTAYRSRYHMTHGDQFKGGSGIAGLMSPLMLGDHRKRKREQAVGTPYDYLMIGHWHQLRNLGSLIVNGSLKGYDEYAAIHNFDFEPPQQAFWLTDPEHGKTIWAPVHCASPDEGWKKPEQEQQKNGWLTTH